MLDRWHLLSLDAPTVAVTWMIAFGWSAGTPVGPATPIALFLAVWALYAGDRLLDARPLSLPADVRLPGRSTADLELRHRFHHRHRLGFIVGLCLVLPSLAACLLWLPRPTLAAEAALAVLLFLWLLLIHGTKPGPGQRRLPKEFAVGPFFAAAVCLPTLAPEPTLWRPLLPAGLLFACVCTLNCLFLYAWEHPRGGAEAHPATRWAMRHLPALAGATLLASLLASVLAAAGVFAHPPSERLGTLPLACALSTALLLLLHRARATLSPLRLRALGDLVLLTPALVLLCPGWGWPSWFPAQWR